MGGDIKGKRIATVDKTKIYSQILKPPDSKK